MATATQQRRKLDFRSWPEVIADVERLHQDGYRRAGNWDLSQIVDHVGEGLRTAVRGNPNQGPWIVRKLFGPIIFRKIVRDRGMRAGLKVPKWWLPGPGHDESAAVEQFRADVQAFEALSTAPCPHPFFGPLTKQQWNDLALIHAAHHLGFLRPDEE